MPVRPESLRAAWRLILVSMVSGLLASTSFAASPLLKLTVNAGSHERVNTPVFAKLSEAQTKSLREAIAGGTTELALVDAAGKKIAADLVTASVLQQSGTPSDSTKLADGPQELFFVLPKLAAGESRQYSLVAEKVGDDAAKRYTYRDTPGKFNELVSPTGKNVLRYMYAPLDTSTEATRFETMKPFHHVYSPDGQRLVTNGAGGRFPHHRGLFYGFMTITHDGDQQADTWHCVKGAYQQHESSLTRVAGRGVARELAKIGWHGRDGQTFADEYRELTAFNTPDGTLLEFASRLVPLRGEVRLDGDPQHAGFHFRADSEVNDKSAAETYYLRPDGQGAKGETRNWDPKTGKGPIDLPWNVMSFVLGGQRYSVAYVDRPTNPKPARYSERDYGRFGSYFVTSATPEKPVDVAYRIWLQPGEMSLEQAKRLEADFNDPPTVTVSAAAANKR